jgi:hypothetical protein
MCQVTAPPTVFLAGPLQAPGGWLVSAVLLALVTRLVLYNSRKYLRQQPSALHRRVGLALLGGAHLLVWTSVVLLVLVVFPSMNALGAWSISQFHTLDTSHCPDIAYAPLNATYNHQLNGLNATWGLVAIVFLVVGFGVELIWWYGFARRPRRLRAQPARQ